MLDVVLYVDVAFTSYFDHEAQNMSLNDFWRRIIVLYGCILDVCLTHFNIIHYLVSLRSRVSILTFTFCRS